MTHFPSDAVCESRYVFPHTPPNHRALVGPFSDLDPPPLNVSTATVIIFFHFIYDPGACI